MWVKQNKHDGYNCPLPLLDKEDNVVGNIWKCECGTLFEIKLLCTWCRINHCELQPTLHREGTGWYIVTDWWKKLRYKYVR